MNELLSKKIYHHTGYDVLAKIVTEKGLSFRGSYYEKFDMADYKWTKEYVSPIIRKLCEEHDCEYTEDSSFKPIIFSFCEKSDSDYMWMEYADHYSGVQLILDAEQVRSYANEHLDYLNECVYLEQDLERIEDFLRNSIGYLRIVDSNNFQYNLEALSCLIKKVAYRVEKEMRYVHPYSKLFSVNYLDFVEKGNNTFHEILPVEDERECYILLPKGTLLGVNIGYQSMDRKKEVYELLQGNGYNMKKVEIGVRGE